jgi:CRP-like cAMP-binding protein
MEGKRRRIVDNILVRKLEGFAPLSSEDKSFLNHILPQSRLVAPREDIVRQGLQIPCIHLVLDGFACRYKLLADGSRQICSFLVPGDMCSMGSFIVRTADHNIGALSLCQVIEIEPQIVLQMLARPAINRALWWISIVHEAVLREWLVNVSQRNAELRLAHLFCELHQRLEVVGLVRNNSFEVPLTQGELADTMGLTSVHVNRTLKSLRAQGLLEFKDKHATIHNIERLRDLCQFDPTYLHIHDNAPPVEDRFAKAS